MDKSALLATEIVRNCPFSPTAGQTNAINSIASFLSSGCERKAFLLCGYAGTGKTSLVSALVRTMRALHSPVTLLAPTGRAAKVLSIYSGAPAYTIHKRIYRQKSILDQSVFTLDRNVAENTLFLVDEASMISNEGLSGSMFGTGRLLDDLVSYVYSGKGCSMLLLGDSAQLPPVGEVLSPALNGDMLKTYGLSVTQCVLTEVVRQESSSGILHNATLLRDSLPDVSDFNDGRISDTSFRFVLDGFTDVRKISGEDLIERISECYSKDGISDTIVLCRSNKRAIIYNNGIRNTILDREDELCRGDYVMVVKNNYYWTELEQRNASVEGVSIAGIPPFIANGDMAVVRRVRRHRELYGFNFATVQLSFPDYDDYEIEADVLLDTLHSEAPALTKEQQDEFYHNVLEDYADVRDKRERARLLKENPYLNAFQIKYAYAVTCHKAQGGQWHNVFIDQGYIPEDGRDIEYYRWLYTALTRATGTVFLVNWPD